MKKFSQYNQAMIALYSDYLFIEFYYPTIHKAIKDESLPKLNFESAYSGFSEPFKTDYVYGVIDRNLKKTNPNRTFIEIITLTESYLQSIVYRIYRDFPHKLQTELETDGQRHKLIKVILNSADKEEMISHLAEEKIRGIFYGNPVDFFIKDKAKIGIGDYMKNNYKKALQEYSEVIARRNIFIHNKGKVDSKYLREVKLTSFTKGDKPKIDKDYIRSSIKILRTLALIATEQALKDTYGASVKRKYKEYIKKFDKEYKNK